MITLLAHLSVFEDNDERCFPDGREMVRDLKSSTPVHYTFDGTLHNSFCFRVNRVRGFVEDQQRWFGHERTRQRDELLLPGREPTASLLHIRVIAIRQKPNEMIGAYFSSCPFHSFG